MDVDSWEIFCLYSERQDHPSLAEVKMRGTGEAQGQPSIVVSSVDRILRVVKSVGPRGGVAMVIAD